MIAKSIRVYLSSNLPIIAKMVGHMAIGAVAGQLLITWTSLTGSSVWSLGTLIAACIFGLLVFRGSVQRLQATVFWRSIQSRGGLVQFGISLAFGGVMLLLVWLTPDLLSAALALGSQAFGNSPATLTQTPGLFVILALALPALMIAMLITSSMSWHAVCSSVCNPVGRTDIAEAVLCGSLGMCLLLIHSATTLPLSVTVAAVIAVSMALYAAAYRLSDIPEREHLTTTDVLILTIPIEQRLQAIAAGLVIGALVEIASLLMPVSLPVLLPATLMTSLLIWLGTRRILSSLIPAQLAAVPAIVLISCLPLAFSRLIDINLALNSSVRWPWLLILARSLQISIISAAALLPLFLLPGTSTRKTPNRSAECSGTASAVGILWGTLLAVLALCSGTPPRWILAAGMLLLLVTLMRHLLSSGVPDRGTVAMPGQQRFHSRGLRMCSAILVSGLFFAIMLLPSDHSGRAVQLLFSSRSLAAFRMGIDPDLIPQSDSSRLVRTLRTPQGEVHVWRRSGHVFELLRNGFSMGRVSINSALTPQPIEDVLPAILPLVVHPAPDRILVLGDETGVCLRTCSHFPVQRIVAVRDDLQLTELAKEYAWRGQQPAPEQDSRISLIHGQSMVAVRVPSEVRFDVVIAAYSASGMAAGSPEFSTEFYQHIRQQLTEQGVFCQRFRQYDLGPEPLKQVLSTAMASFRHVVAVQSAPGEIVLLAGNSEARFLNHQVLSRLQHDFIRREIALSGWDWVQVAILPMLDAADPVGVFGQQVPPAPLTIHNSHFALTLPVEVHRRIDRPAELHAAFSPYQLRLAEAIPPDESHHEIRRRISLLSQQVEILAGMPDEPWTYRKSLRTEMQRNPRPPREVIRDNQIVRDVHPIDRLQQDYFVTLGESVRNVQSGNKSLSAFAELTRYTAQHEPLLSFFAHYELIRLHEMAEHPAPAEEYHHRLHTIFFTEQSDASVRPVIAAMQQLIEHPELLDSDAERFDQLNSLLQKLIERWEARTAWEPRSATRVQNDVDQSVLVTGRALDKLQEWSVAVDVPESEFLKRRRFIHSALTHPLRDYREQVLAHRLKHQKAEPADVSAPDDLPLMLNPSELSTN